VGGFLEVCVTKTGRQNGEKSFRKSGDPDTTQETCRMIKEGGAQKRITDPRVARTPRVGNKEKGGLRKTEKVWVKTREGNRGYGGVNHRVQC